MRVVISLLVSSALMLAGCNRQKSDKVSEKKIEQNSVRSRIDTPTEIAPFLQDKVEGIQPGQIVFLNDVSLEPGPTKNGYYAVGPKGGRIFVVLNEAPPQAATEKPDVKFDVRGSVERTPTTRTMRRQWKMKKDEASEVQKIGVYLEAESVSAAGE